MSQYRIKTLMIVIIVAALLFGAVAFINSEASRARSFTTTRDTQKAWKTAIPPDGNPPPSK